jgi:hypothetical protein
MFADMSRNGWLCRDVQGYAALPADTLRSLWRGGGSRGNVAIRGLRSRRRQLDGDGSSLSFATETF